MKKINNLKDLKNIFPTSKLQDKEFRKSDLTFKVKTNYLRYGRSYSSIFDIFKDKYSLLKNEELVLNAIKCDLEDLEEKNEVETYISCLDNLYRESIHRYFLNMCPSIYVDNRDVYYENYDESECNIKNYDGIIKVGEEHVIDGVEILEEFIENKLPNVYTYNGCPCIVKFERNSYHNNYIIYLDVPSLINSAKESRNIEPLRKKILEILKEVKADIYKIELYLNTISDLGNNDLKSDQTNLRKNIGFHYNYVVNEVSEDVNRRLGIKSEAAWKHSAKHLNEKDIMDKDDVLKILKRYNEKLRLENEYKYI